MLPRGYAPVVASEQRFWPSRLRWRLRGAWTWPTFAVLTVADAVLLHELPPWRTGVDPVPALLMATFGNLIIVGALAPWLLWMGERRARQRGEDPIPREVTLDRLATGLLCVGAVAIVLVGLAARPATIVETEAREINAEEVRRFVEAEAPPDVRANLDAGASNTVRLQEDGYFRNCVPYEDRSRHFCFFVDTKTDPPTVRRDPSTLNNNDFLRGPSGP
jgi:hypothetical protein